MVANPGLVNFSAEIDNEHWLCFCADSVIKLAPLTDRATLGNAHSSSIRLEGRGMVPLHGQFFLEGESFWFRNFQTRQTLRLDACECFLVGDWKVKRISMESLRAEFGAQILEAFKKTLKESPQGVSAALESIRKAWFLGGEIPASIRRHLEAQVSEISLDGPVEYLLALPDVTDILVESFDHIWVERSGELRPSGLRFTNSETYEIYIENLLAQLGRTVDDHSPFLDFVLSDGSRGHLIVPPLTAGARYLSIRKIRRNHFTLKELLDVGMFDSSTLKLFHRAIQDRKNILVSGATGSGKTTLLKALLAEVPRFERLVVIEDTAELGFARDNAAFLYSRMDLRGSLPPVSLRDLVKQSLRMRPDRIVIGEVRGEEALDLMHAMNTGHRGCMSSLHANSTRDAVLRLQGLIQMSSSRLSEGAMRDLIARNLHMVFHCGRDGTGRRRVLECAQIRGIDQSQILMETQSL